MLEEREQHNENTDGPSCAACRSWIPTCTFPWIGAKENRGSGAQKAAHVVGKADVETGDAVKMASDPHSTTINDLMSEPSNPNVVLEFQLPSLLAASPPVVEAKVIGVAPARCSDVGLP